MTTPDSAASILAARYQKIRAFSLELCSTLSAEDCGIQTMPDVSPARWHLAHTTWFFETFILAKRPGHKPFDANFTYLFNSYYNAVGDQYPRHQRGLLSRPNLAEVQEYRRYVDECMADVFASEEALADAAERIEVGLHHEQQHQELILTDIKHVLAHNPLFPVYREASFMKADPPAVDRWIQHAEGTYWIGASGDGFSFDNESPSHREFIDAFELNSDLVSCGDYIEFIEDGGYRRPELWLSLGWEDLREQRFGAPLYWRRVGNAYHHYTLAGELEVDPALPVCHVSYFEADAFARWSGARLPTEAEWEVASKSVAVDGNFVDSLLSAGRAVHPADSVAGDAPIRRMFGDVWEWTASPYTGYPGFSPPEGALGEYNGKFMCNQYVLRGGSCATSRDHIRHTYRNFFPPEARWQFSGIRLARGSAPKR